ncbi:phosphoribosyltransferase-like protein [Delftia acidovorans]|uniref:phosphoribosyltransferase-like protein n=1 Tax=Delftia acidovorans TaxID=80866 RepID=UPI0028B210DF|nr:hypothetical protein [Delftia acidovorans]
MEIELDIEQRNDWDSLRKRILVLNERAWDGRLEWPAVQRWLNNFNGRSGVDVAVERLHALYLLSQMMYFGGREIRVLLRALYIDLVLVPTIQLARQRLGGSRNERAVEREVITCLKKTRFLGVGNPSESGVHLLYYFRQENGLPKNFFLDSASIFSRSTVEGKSEVILRDDSVDRYIFLDDLCGSGETAEKYSEDLLPRILAVDSNVELHYYSIFATSKGLERVREKSLFAERCGAVYELDDSYKSLSEASRYLTVLPKSIDKNILMKINLYYGDMVCPGHATGFEDGQLLLAFSHNTPDNTLPIIWRDQENGSPVPWDSALKRYPKYK